MKVIILTGDEIRHEFFRKKIASREGINVLASYCEGSDQSLEVRTSQNEQSSLLERQHVEARTQSEKDFFWDWIEVTVDLSNPKKIKKGDINAASVVSEILSLKPDLLICYGSSLIKSRLLDVFARRFLNVHLGLSPYYRGSGTNVWPLINREPHMVGATFMHIDTGIDTGNIIHQIRADISLGDSPHSIGNRLIKNMADVYGDIIESLHLVTDEVQPVFEGRLYRQKDFDSLACQAMYDNFNDGMVSEHLDGKDVSFWPNIVTNAGLG